MRLSTQEDVCMHEDSVEHKCGYCDKETGELFSTHFYDRRSGQTISIKLCDSCFDLVTHPEQISFSIKNKNR